MGKLYDRMQGDLKLKNYAPGTQQAYLQCATRYAQFHVGRSPSVLGEREVRDFLLDLALKLASPAVMKMHLASLRFLYSTTLRRPEVERLLATMEPLKHRAVVMTAYGAGLRISGRRGRLAPSCSRGKRRSGRSDPAQCGARWRRPSTESACRSASRRTR